ncbi:hypothetical protein DEU56DRAFT_737355 [Suillus clintonianus]|uniref:uncharacterized protein n=1 Tax=Suillus clintonianus TaxID=1904413 RepID=UPI001B87B907|nr:uncharacterized protein DEU56DRAFT_737355 [Suillus clintonianus]KAG2136020.1 hypothetical protein DEU56DRAFT_737355 [Suillus clintonianus]
MVTADNLNLDVLELIFAFISGNDLVAVSSVSKSFLAGVIPCLYATVSFTAKHAKRYRPGGGTISPFLTLRNHPDLAVHVRHVNIHCAPFIAVGQVHPNFLSETADALQICKNLLSFVCGPRILPALLGSLQGKERLQDVHIYAAFTTTQGEMLQKMTTLRSLTLDYPTWNVIDSLTRWAHSLQRTLAHLTIFMSQEVNGVFLEALLPLLPRLRGLHVVGCSKAPHTAVIKATTTHTPSLKALSFTIFENTPPSNLFCLPTITLPNLRHLAIDVRPTSDATAAIMPSLFNSLTSLSTLLLKFADRQLPIWSSVIDGIAPPNAVTMPLKRLALMDCSVSIDTVRKLSSRCKDLEMLEIPLPIKDIQAFTTAISSLKELHTLTDVGDAHASHGPRASLTRNDARFMMESCVSLKTIVSDGRMWTVSSRILLWPHPVPSRIELTILQGRPDFFLGVTVTPQRYKANTTQHWFSPLKTDSS